VPFWPPESPLNTIERAFQRAGYAVVIGTDYTVRPTMGFVLADEVEIARAPDEDDALLSERALAWLAENSGADISPRRRFSSGGEW
jgi:hypothetical protein